MKKLLMGVVLMSAAMGAQADVVKECDVKIIKKVGKAWVDAYKTLSSFTPALKATVVEHGDSFTYIDTIGIEYTSGKLKNDHGDLAYEDKEENTIYATNKNRSKYGVFYLGQNRGRALVNCKEVK